MEWIYACLQLVLSEVIDFSAFLCYNQIKNLSDNSKRVWRVWKKPYSKLPLNLYLYGTWANFQVEDSKARVRTVLWFFYVVLFEKAVIGWQQ